MIRISRRKNLSKAKKISIQISTIILALLVSSVFILITKNNPIEVYAAMLKGAFGSPYRLKETIIKTIPLTILSLGILISFKLKFWNIGAEGQYIMGAFMGSYFALNFSELPKPLLIFIILIAGFIGGGIWALIPAFFRAKYRTNETIFTLLMNYIALKWITYLQYGPWRDPNSLGFPKIPNFKQSAILPNIFGVHIGLIITLLLVGFIYFYLKHTKSGYEISVVGESENTAVYSGMDVKKIILRTLLISGGLCGLAGIVQASAVSKTLSVSISSGLGFTAIITAWLSNLNAYFALVASFLFAAMQQGATFIQMTFNIPDAAANVIQGMILFFVLGSSFFLNYEISIEK